MLLATMLVSAVSLALAASPALAQGSGSDGSGYYVTFVARVCANYSDIYANRARNDIVESLKDLGPDTQYGDSGALISPVYEDQGAQLNCDPLPGWQFTMGTGYQSRVVTGLWGSLSKVTGAFDTSILTQSSTPLLDYSGGAVPGQTVAGATTIELTNAERGQASEPDQLWVQGGTPTDPVSCADLRRPGIRVRHAPLRHRQPQRGQRRVRLLPSGRLPRVLLRLLRQAPAHDGSDHHPEGGDRHPERGQPGVPVQRKSVVQSGRVPAVQRRLGGLLPSRRFLLDGDRGRGRQLQARVADLCQRVRWSGQHVEHQRVDGDDQPGRAEPRDVHVHESVRAAAGGPADSEDHQRRGRDVHLRRDSGERRHGSERDRDDHRGERPRRCGPVVADARGAGRTGSSSIHRFRPRGAGDSRRSFAAIRAGRPRTRSR